MSAFINVFIYSFLAGLSTMLGVFLVLRFNERVKKNINFLLSFGIGVLLAYSFFHLLPESSEMTENWPYWTLGTIIFLYILEHFVIIHSCQEEKCEVHNLGLASLIGIGLHSLIDGMVIGLGFEVSFIFGLLASFSVIFHETAEGILTYTLLAYDKKTENKAMLFSWLVALATPVGAVLTFLFAPHFPLAVMGGLLAVAAGSFIYIGASDLVPETHKKYNSFNILFILLGIFFVLFIGRFLK
ncbi:MAG: ZIP family metal transporter [Patescibacteria group bacterium]